MRSISSLDKGRLLRSNWPFWASLIRRPSIMISTCPASEPRILAVVSEPMGPLLVINTPAARWMTSGMVWSGVFMISSFVMTLIGCGESLISTSVRVAVTTT